MLSGMIVHKDQCRGGKLKRTLNDLERIDRRMIDGADLLDFVEDQLITLVEKEHAKLLLVAKAIAVRQ